MTGNQSIMTIANNCAVHRTAWLTGIKVSAGPAVALAGLLFLVPVAQAKTEGLNTRISAARNAKNPAIRAVRAAVARKHDEALKLAKPARNPVADKVIEWLYLRQKPSEAGYQRIMAFIKANPNWPARKHLYNAAERVLFAGQANPGLVIAHFRRRAPATVKGRLALAAAYLAKGNKKAARRHVLKSWYNPRLRTADKKIILARFSKLLTRANHEQRLWRLILAQQKTAAIRTAVLVSKRHVHAAKVAAALIARKSNATVLYKKLPSSLQRKIAMRYVYARYFRKTGDYARARALLLAAPVRHASLIDPQAWWIERRLIVRRSLALGTRAAWPQAYKLAGMHGYRKGKHFIEGEFLQGWIALRFMDNPARALKHFARILPAARSRTDKSRADYWLARAYLAYGAKAKADAYFRKAARTPTLYYARLALEALGNSRRRITIPRIRATKAQKAKVARHELVRAFQLVLAAGSARDARLFLWPMARSFRSKGELAAIAAMINRRAGAFMTVRFAKAAGAYGYDLDYWSYPRRALPRYKRIGRKVETALVYGLSRQESEFNLKARSGAGARGPMQLMPGTAKRIARRHKVAYSKARLAAGGSYNVMLGAAHLGELIDRFSGSYVLTFVAYNAGPRRVGQWIEAYGDPRNAGRDPVDWVESVPFTETRKYIKKVLQNVHVYRSLLAPSSMAAMSTDLARGTRPQISAAGVNQSKAACNGSAKSLSALIAGC